jgi:NDP-sugar pyrophosphorylase family protein
MNVIEKSPLEHLGYHFIPDGFLRDGMDESYLRLQQQPQDKNYRKLSKKEIRTLEKNGNKCDNWANIFVSEGFNADQVIGCHFYGLIRIGNLAPICLEFHEIKKPVGLYHSTIVSCDFGDNVCIHHVRHLSHYIIGNEVIITNVDEMGTTHHAKFGNGMIKEGEEEKNRVWLEVSNENAGRKIIPFDGMLPGDAWLWSRYRDDEQLQSRFKTFAEQLFDTRHGFYGMVGDRTVIKSCKVIKDVHVGTDAYLKGANKLKNLTIRSSKNAVTQIGEGCELVNGIIEEKCRIFYGVKAVRFYLASNSQLKYGSRLINSYLGNNSTISCCEVLNSLIYPAHEQHHNNSFLCAATIKGQSNIAAGATLGSNHNSRSADGELIAGRGFWPALCVSIKHNSQFASYTLLAKGDYPTELNISLPFSLVSNDTANDRLIIMPAYWLMYNMYALARNSGKYIQRDGRPTQAQHLEYHYLAPDTINEIMEAFTIIEYATGKAYCKHHNDTIKKNEAAYKRIGKKLLRDNNAEVDKLEIVLEGVENSSRKVVLIKARAAYLSFMEMVQLYCAEEILKSMNSVPPTQYKKWIQQNLKASKRKDWINVGGQLIQQNKLEQLLSGIRSGKIKSWEAIHQFYTSEAAQYEKDKLNHALASYYTLNRIDLTNKESLKILVGQALATKSKMLKNIISSREKDYTSPFRTMVYANRKEMDAVTGKLEENSFILEQTAALKKMKAQIRKLFV